jgi:hypothetical protein
MNTSAGAMWGEVVVKMKKGGRLSVHERPTLVWDGCTMYKIQCAHTCV